MSPSASQVFGALALLVLITTTKPALADTTQGAACSEPAAAEPGSPAALSPDGAKAPAAVSEFERASEQLAAGEDAEARSTFQRAAALADAAGAAELAARARANAIRIALSSESEAVELSALEGELNAQHAAVLALTPEQGQAPLLVNQARSELRLVRAQPQLASASALRRRAVEALARAQSVSSASGDVRTESYALAYLGEVYERAGRYDEALELTRRALFAAQAANAPEALFRWQWQLGRIQKARGEGEAALAAYRSSVHTLSELRSQSAGVSSDRQAAFRREVAPVYEGLVDLLLSRLSDDGQGPGDQELLREARDALEDLKAAELRDYFRDSCLDAERKSSPDDIAGAFVVYPVILPDRLELIASDSGVLSRHRSEIDAETLNGAIHAFRQALVKRTTYQYLAQGRQLYEWLIRPLRPRLDASQVDTLVWVPGGALRTIPMAALRDREAKEFLIEQFPLAITPGLTLTEPSRIDRDVVQLLAAGISESVMGYPPLENVPRELAVLAEVFPGDQIMNAEFSVDNFSREMARAPHGIVHIASHGEFAADTSQSYLLAYDEKLSMDRLALLVAATRFRDQPLELLTLSACKTAAGDEKAALGLAGVALQAGARSALATLWSVDDAAAADLVSEFYIQLGNPELSRAQALQRAQLATMKQFRYRHAAYWAPFLLISSWL